MEVAKPGDLVIVRYDGLLPSGEIFETSQETGPLEFQIGDNTVLSGFNDGVVGMRVGESREIILKPEEAYGPKNPDLVEIFARSAFAPEMEIKVGMIIGMSMEKEGKDYKVPAQVMEIDDDGVKLDFNHPLSGKEITYKITLDKLTPGDAEDNSSQSLNPSSPSGSTGCGSS